MATGGFKKKNNNKRTPNKTKKTTTNIKETNWNFCYSWSYAVRGTSAVLAETSAHFSNISWQEFSMHLCLYSSPLNNGMLSGSDAFQGLSLSINKISFKPTVSQAQHENAGWSSELQPLVEWHCLYLCTCVFSET